MGKEKPPDKRRNDTVKFKATAAEKKSYEDAGNKYSEDMSKWIREVLNAELKRLRKAEKD